MPVYRVYRLDGAGKVWSAEWIEADDDAAALDVARKMADAAHIEVWQTQRLVGRIDPEPQAPA